MTEIGEKVAEHYNSLEEKGLEERTKSRIFYLRNFNNWIKSMLIGEIVQKTKANKKHGDEIRVLDIGCGKGGDILKWKKGDVNHIVFADIANTSIEQCEQRFHKMCDRNNRKEAFTAQFITADCTKKRLLPLYDNSDIEFDIVSCQFAFHYCFESVQQVEQMLQNVSERLRVGGYFIGTTPDSLEIVKRLKDSDSLSYGNDVYSITFEDKDKFALFGAKYNFHLIDVVDCPEFLVYFPLLIEIAKKYDLELMFKTRFDDYFDHCIQHADERVKKDARQLLGRMQALETFPPFDDTDMCGDAEKDYQHAKDKLELLAKEGNNIRKLGTLSLAEWEAATLYVVFAFRKISSDQGTKRKRETAEEDDLPKNRK